MNATATVNRNASNPHALAVHDVLVNARSRELTLDERAVLRRAPVRLADGRLALIEGVCCDGCDRVLQVSERYGVECDFDRYVVTVASGERLGCVSAYDMRATGLATA